MGNDSFKEMRLYGQKAHLETIDKALHFLIAQYKNGYEKNVTNQQIRDHLQIASYEIIKSIELINLFIKEELEQ
jgi:hypothetical protein|uniref:Uncharacterized protein n=1 Tax=uncultured Caudovirales phage TaxID=2100421 RepID=A0A6J5KV78_9CAUD|nr:hypothetical protein UFOVP88_42 [uncultured Caudovirales phage]